MLEVKPGKYRTRDGSEVRIWYRDGMPEGFAPGGMRRRWYTDGAATGEDRMLDLIARIDDEPPVQAEQPEKARRQHVSDAAWAVYPHFDGDLIQEQEDWHQQHGLVLLTVADVEDLEHSVACMPDIREELTFLRAEVEKLTSSLGEARNTSKILAAALDEASTLLRKGREDGHSARDKTSEARDPRVTQAVSMAESGSHVCGASVPYVMSTGEQNALSRALLRSVSIIDSGHRLGLPQPSGEPCEPMSARKPYRWSPMV